MKRAEERMRQQRMLLRSTTSEAVPQQIRGSSFACFCPTHLCGVGVVIQRCAWIAEDKAVRRHVEGVNGGHGEGDIQVLQTTSQIVAIKADAEGKQQAKLRQQDYTPGSPALTAVAKCAPCVAAASAFGAFVQPRDLTCGCVARRRPPMAVLAATFSNTSRL